jgi:prevent-host-death family protein
MSTTTTRALRENLSRLAARASRGEEIVVTRRGRPYVRLLPAGPPPSTSRYSLRGSVVRMAADFDAPLAELWSALGKAPRR